MSLVPSLLQAILKVDGEALVMHAGEKPYVVAPAGQIELASRGLTLEAVNGIVGQLLPTELQRALDEFGAVQYELPAAPEFPASISRSSRHEAVTISGSKSAAGGTGRGRSRPGRPVSAARCASRRRGRRRRATGRRRRATGRGRRHRSWHSPESHRQRSRQPLRR